MMNLVSKEVKQLLQTMALFDTQIRSYLEFLQANIRKDGVKAEMASSG
ncbi:hypothetical protein HYS47_00970 [Candidatus Woesearchaeota archaeon]|nr:hypothetical protein [Candidatus Woesearchaeota archaeon]